MPFQSNKQRSYMFAKHPEIAKKWADKYDNKKDLPEYKNTDKRPQIKSPWLKMK